MYEHVDHRFLFLVEMGGGGNLGVAKHNGVNACCEAEKHSTTCMYPKNMVCSWGGELRNRMRLVGPYHLYKVNICTLNYHTKYSEVCIQFQGNIRNALEW